VRSVELRTSVRAQALVELALILPVLLLLFVAALDLGRLFYSSITLSNAAREGAMEASVNPTSFVAGAACNKSNNRVMCRAVNEASGSFVTVSPSGVTLTCTPSCAKALGNDVTVRVEGQFSVITPIIAYFLGGQSVAIAAEATAQIATAPVGGVASTPTPSPTPTPTPTPTPAPTATPTGSPGPTATPTAAPTPSPTPACFVPDANFSVNPTSGSRRKNQNFPGTTFVFTDSSTNMTAGCGAVWSWNFGDGSGSSSLQNPTYVYTSANTNPGFLVTLTVSNSMGNSSFSVRIPVTN
jgi:Flp pilus assembly protein TadG